jgi:transcriptional regulator with XRE-family HTH domain
MARASQTRVGLEYLRAWRVWKGYSQQELAELARVAKSTITQLELGRATANFVTVGKLAKALNLSREQLLHETPEPRLPQPNV